MKFKVGDKVKIINVDGYHTVDSMRSYIGNICIIKNITQNGNIYVSGNDYFWK